MLEMKKVTKLDGKMKSLHFADDVLVNEDGEVVDLHKYLKSAYEDSYFDLSFTSKVEEIVEVEIEDEDVVDIEDLQ